MPIVCLVCPVPGEAAQDGRAANRIRAISVAAAPDVQRTTSTFSPPHLAGTPAGAGSMPPRWCIALPLVPILP